MRNVKNIFIFLFAAVLSVGCIYEKYEVSVQKQNVMIEMSVSAGEMTKAEASDSEKTINSLRVYAFNGGKIVGYAFRQATHLGEPFYMDLDLPEHGTHQVDFYLIANEAEMAYENGLVQLSENMTISQLEEVRFTGLSEKSALPMYSKLRVSLDVDNLSSELNDEEGHVSHPILDQKINFDLTRSLAKLSIYAAKAPGAASDPQILSVQLLSSGTREYSYLFPQSEAVLDAVPTRSNNRTLSDASVTISAEVAKGTLEAESAENYDPVVFGKYMPEVSAGYSTGDPSYAWNISSGEEKEAVLFFEYVLGEGQELNRRYVYLPRVERNTHLKVCILINAEGQIIINYTVADWELEEDNMNDWFFDYPTHSYIRQRIPFSNNDLDERPSSKAVMSETAPFTGYFQMTYPENDTWKPTLVGLNGSNCNIKVYDADNELVFSSDAPVPIPVSPDWYRIEVYPFAGRSTEGGKVNLAITYTPSGLEESEYLLINGSYNNYYWPESEDENFVTITMVN